MINDENKRSIKQMLKSNGLYFALGLCLLAAAVVGFSAADSMKLPSATDITTRPVADNSEENEIKIPEIEEPTEYFAEIAIDEFTTLAQEEPSTQAVFDNSAEPLNEETTVKEVIFSVPLSLSMGKDFSRGIPVFSQTMNDYRTHNGVDFKGVKGESVKTVAEGTVISVEKDAVWGNTVAVDHGNGIVSYISGLADEALVTAGATLYSDTVIGVVGTVPIESGEDSHIHLEIRANGELVDPLEILGLSGE